MAGLVCFKQGQSRRTTVKRLEKLTCKQDEHLTKILFTKAHALCHDVNRVTKTSSHIDIVMGFSTSDIIWYEPMSQKYARINKNVRGNPRSSATGQLFLAGT